MRRRYKIAIAAAMPAALALPAVFAVFIWTHPYPMALLAPDQGEPIVLTDRNGTPIRQVEASTRPGKESWVPIDAVSAHAISTLLASEDQRFFEHHGVDPLALIRALYLNVVSDGHRFGGSTITMQLMRLVHSREKARTLFTKIKESLLALRLERSATKQEILEQYLNRVYFGNGAFGIEAAAKRYFGKPAASLSTGEATYLMVLPRGPSYYDPLKHRDRVRARRNHLIDLLVKQGRMTKAEARRALAEKVTASRHPLPFDAPHFTDWILAELPADILKSGGRVRTTLNMNLQTALQHRAAEHVASLAKQGVEQAGAVVLDAETGDVLAMVGSRGYDEGSQVNITTRRRFPGSALKPFVYAAAIEQLGHAPSSIAYDIVDVPSDYRVRGMEIKEHGPVRYREALAGSYNLAAVHVLEKVGIAPVMAILKRAGVGALDGSPEDYGLRLALGSTKVRLLDLAAGYRFIVKEGSVVPPRAILNAMLPGNRKWQAAVPEETRVFSKETAWLVMDMLADPEARRPMFGQELPADLPYPVVVKTGTARGFADTVAIFATSEYIVAAWTGRFDGGPTDGLFGMKAAAPLARAGLLLASQGRNLTLPKRPDTIEAAAVCALSGKRPTEACPHLKRDYFVKGQIPGTPCDWHRIEQGHVAVQYPEEIQPYVERNRRRLGQVAYARP